ncbi:hypothetical protein Tco_0009291 [Tanacetum coccineum]
MLGQGWGSPTDWSGINPRNNGEDRPDQAKDASSTGSTKELRLSERKQMEFEVGDRVMLKVSPWKGVVRFGKRGKLNPRYVGPFKVLAKVGKVAYRLELPHKVSRGNQTIWLRFAGTLGGALSSPGNVKIRSNKITHNSSQTGLRHLLQGLKLWTKLF